MLLKSLVLALSSLLVFGACGKKNKKRSPQIQYFIHGNPLGLIQNTTRAQSFLTPANLASFDGFHGASAFGFVERDELEPPKDWATVEKENSTEASDTEISSEFTLTTYAFKQESATRYVWAPNAGGRGYTFGFQLENGVLNLTDFDGIAVKPEHYSLKSDNRAFSVLFSAQDNASGRILIAFYFAASDVVTPVTNGSKDYAFLYDNIKIAWNEPISVDSCGTYAAPIESTIQKSIDGWLVDGAPTGTRRPITHTIRTTYAPFSDLNEHCILPVSGFKQESSLDFYVAGVTLPVINRANKTIVDADLMLFMDHTPVNAQMNSGEKSSVLMHELGHFFGLGHEFKTDAAGKALYPSIMGYSQGTTVVTEWDFEAIRDLYGESFGAPTP